MNLKQLYKLQQCYKEIENSERILSRSRDIEILRNLKKQFDSFKEEYNDIKVHIEEIKGNYSNLDGSINSLREQIKKDEYILYNESGNNMKLIQSLQEDIKVNKDNVECMENKIIEIMGLEEELVDKKNEVRERVLDIREKFYNKKQEDDSILKECKENIEKVKIEIEEIEHNIPEELLKMFNKLREEKHIAICKVENGVCEGCKISIACETMDSLKNDDITYCDNCGRILYKEN